MQHFFPRIGKSVLIKAALGLVLLHAPLVCEDPPTPEDTVGFLFSSGKVKKTPVDVQDQHNTPSFKVLDKKKDTYTINFNNVSIIEYIKFASKITNLNFVYNDDELQFTFSVISEEPVTPRNIISILIQELRIHGLIVLEQDNNLLITKVRNVSQLATVVASDLPAVQSNAPLVTRVFRIKNANLNTVASVIQPMLSDSALLEVSPETKQLIITDITTNVDKISSLLASIDAPHSPLEIDSYVAKSGDLDALIKLATQILSPFSEGNVLTFVPQTETQTIFIISTPFLIERAMTILEDLETTNMTAAQLATKGQTVYLYKLQHKTGDDFISALDDLAKQLKKRGASAKLVDSLDEAKWIKESNSILFIADEPTLDKIKELIPTLDTTTTEVVLQKSNFYVYKIQHAPYQQLENSIDSMAENLQKAPKPDYALIDVLTSAKYLPDANSIVFTGDTAALSKLAEILPSLDVASNQAISSEFLIYNPRNRTGEQLEKSIQVIAKDLKNAGLADPLFLQSVQSVKWTPANNSLIFTGTPDALARIQAILVSLDGGTEGVAGGVGGQTFYLYKLQHASGNTVITSLKKVSSNLNASNIPNQALLATLQNIKWIKENNSLLLTGSNSAIEQARTLIEQFDVASGEPSPETNKSAFFIYKPLHLKPQELQGDILALVKDLQGSGLVDPDLILTLNTVRYVDSTQSLLFTGSPAALEKVKEILARTDVVAAKEGIQQLGESTFLIYKIQYVPSSQLISTLKGLTSDLQRAGTLDQAVATSINNLKYIKDSNSLLFTGAPETLQKLEVILKKFDISGTTGPATPSTFIVYTPKYIPGDELIEILTEFEQNLVASGVANKELFDTISNLKYVSRTCSLIISGDQESIAKVEELLRRFDVPTAEPGKIASSIESIQNTSFLIYKLEYHQGDEILSALKQIATDLGTGTATGNQNLLNAINSLQWIRVTNSLLASGEAETLTKLRDLIVNLDVPLRQVFIEVLLIQTTLSNTQNFGLQWGGKLQYLNRVAAGSGNFPAPSTNAASTSNSINPGNTGFSSIAPELQAVNTTRTPFPNPQPGSPGIPFTNGFDLGVIGDIIMHKGRSFLSLGSLVNALQTDTDSTVVLNPKIITQDNRTSTLFVGTNVPFIGSQVTSTTSIISSSSNIEYRDVGFNLTITPTIGNSNVVTLDISNDISQIISNPTIGTSGVASTTGGTVNGIESSHTTMATRVHVPDQHFVVLSGMIQDTKTRYKSGIPCLGGLPVIGVIFSENDRNDTKTNLIIFLRPQIINTYEDYKKVTDEQECTFKDQAVMPVLKEEFDAGIDIVKRAEDE